MENKQMKPLSKNQLAFIRSAERQGFTVTEYSGRFMYGSTCPAVILSPGQEFRTRTHHETDSMGLGTVVYASS